MTMPAQGSRGAVHSLTRLSKPAVASTETVSPPTSSRRKLNGRANLSKALSKSGTGKLSNAYVWCVREGYGHTHDSRHRAPHELRNAAIMSIFYHFQHTAAGTVYEVQ